MIYENGRINISTTLIATTIDTIISVCTNLAINTGAKNGIELLLKTSTIRKTFISEIFDFFLNNKVGKFVLWTIVKIGMVVAGKKGALGTIVDNALQDFLANIAFSKSIVLQQSYSIISSLSSIGGIVSLVLDLMDRKWDNYLSLKII